MDSLWGEISRSKWITNVQMSVGRPRTLLAKWVVVIVVVIVEVVIVVAFYSLVSFTKLRKILFIATKNKTKNQYINWYQSPIIYLFIYIFLFTIYH